MAPVLSARELYKKFLVTTSPCIICIMNLKLFEEYFVIMMPEVSHYSYGLLAKVKIQERMNQPTWIGRTLRGRHKIEAPLGFVSACL
jgi:hypothetical protein